jgi:aldehyde dehydrogenase (NAD+)
LNKGAKILYGGRPIDAVPGGHYVTPAIVSAKNHYPVVQQETFAPILY